MTLKDFVISQLKDHSPPLFPGLTQFSKWQTDAEKILAHADVTAMLVGQLIYFFVVGQ